MQEEVKWKIEILTAILSLTLFEMKQCHGPLKEIPQALSHSAKAETKEIFFRACATAFLTFLRIDIKVVGRTVASSLRGFGFT